MDLASLLPHISAQAHEDPVAAAEAAAAAAIEEARQQQAEQVRAELTAEYEQKLSEQTAQHQQELEAARREWCETQAIELASSITSQINEAAGRLSDAMVRCLVPVLGDLLNTSAVADLCSKVQQAAASDLKAEIRLEGPQDFVDKVAAALATQGFGDVTASSRDGMLQARVGESRLVSRLPEWLQGLTEMVHG